MRVRQKNKRLFSYADINGNPTESVHAALSPYLFDASNVQNKHLVVVEANQPIENVKKIVIGSKPIDGGYYIFTEEERAELLKKEPKAAAFLHPYIGSEEFINGNVRYILALQNASPSALRAMSAVAGRVSNVAKFRRGEIPGKKLAARDSDAEPKIRGKGTVELAKTPTSFHVTVIPKSPFLAIPEVS